MGKAQILQPDQIGALTALCKAGHPNKEIAEITGISLKSVQRWSKKFRDLSDDNISLQKKSTDSLHKVIDQKGQIISYQA